MNKTKIKTLRWIAPVAMAGVLGFAACGGEDAAEDARTEARVATRGSDTHLYNQAEQVAERSAIRAEQAERKAKLDGQAKTYGTSDHNLPNPIEAGNRAALAAEAERYVEQLEASAESTQVGSSHDFVPGSRHMPVR